MEITYTIKSDRIDDLFRKLIRRSVNLRPALVSIGEKLAASIEQNFEDEGRPEKWKPLSEPTLRARREKGYTGPILQASGQLAASIANNIDVEADAVYVGTNKEYGKYMHFGTKQIIKPRQRMWLWKNLGIWKEIGDELKTPARPFMLVQNEDIVFAEKRMLDHLTANL